ncbi:hypothetical protein OO013_17375 [Mangrovivirga sp. M17]|uniref:DUF4148 domain-containing protein n=1 Tax=Mangrovivirga halotolerans TaxID=2993936 RepID=A0ABT3RWR8_9BACT|nr:hypothetical protein [Mangrovivirga halotolerans]MCX2745657.1 hypothetical protein [Mangrovivirga halotolerans]
MKKKIFSIVLVGFVSFVGLQAQHSADGQVSPDGSNVTSTAETKKSKAEEVKNINYFEAARAQYEKKQAIKEKIKNGEVVADEAKTSRSENNN